MDILSEQPKQEKMQERSSLQQRIDLLRSLGCSMDEIQENVEILKLSEQVILRRATMLKVLNLASATMLKVLSICNYAEGT